MPLTFRTYAQLALEDPDGRWELDAGSPRSKPPESFLHGLLVDEVVEQLVPQVRGTPVRLSVNHARIATGPDGVCLPDIAVTPRTPTGRAATQPHGLEVYRNALPLVIDVWATPTREYDVPAKVPEYCAARTDEIWLIHAAAAAVTIWRRLPSGRYDESIRTAGILTALSVPELALDLDGLFRLAGGMPPHLPNVNARSAPRSRH